MADAHLTPTERELSSRTADGIRVRLIWHSKTGRLRIDVVDDRLGTAFELPVAADDAMCAFRHPYAYAAERGLAGDRVAGGRPPRTGAVRP